MADYEVQADARPWPVPVNLSWPYPPDSRHEDWAREGDWWGRVTQPIQLGSQAAAERRAARIAFWRREDADARAAQAAAPQS
eukprot:4488239-Alexandrium_andersonii.AAC.1